MTEITVLEGVEAIPPPKGGAAGRVASRFMQDVYRRLKELKDGQVLCVKGEPGLKQVSLSSRLASVRKKGFVTASRTTADGVFGYIWRP